MIRKPDDPIRYLKVKVDRTLNNKGRSPYEAGVIFTFIPEKEMIRRICTEMEGDIVKAFEDVNYLIIAIDFCKRYLNKETGAMEITTFPEIEKYTNYIRDLRFVMRFISLVKPELLEVQKKYKNADDIVVMEQEVLKYCEENSIKATCRNQLAVFKASDIITSVCNAKGLNPADCDAEKIALMNIKCKTYGIKTKDEVGTTAENCDVKTIQYHEKFLRKIKGVCETIDDVEECAIEDDMTGKTAIQAIKDRFKLHDIKGHEMNLDYSRIDNKLPKYDLLRMDYLDHMDPCDVFGLPEEKCNTLGVEEKCKEYGILRDGMCDYENNPRKIRQDLKMHIFNPCTTHELYKVQHRRCDFSYDYMKYHKKQEEELKKIEEDEKKDKYTNALGLEQTNSGIDVEAVEEDESYNNNDLERERKEKEEAESKKEKEQKEETMKIRESKLENLIYDSKNKEEEEFPVKDCCRYGNIELLQKAADKYYAGNSDKKNNWTLKNILKTEKQCYDLGLDLIECSEINIRAKEREMKEYADACKAVKVFDDDEENAKVYQTTI